MIIAQRGNSIPLFKAPSWFALGIMILIKFLDPPQGLDGMVIHLMLPFVICLSFWCYWVTRDFFCVKLHFLVLLSYSQLGSWFYFDLWFFFIFIEIFSLFWFSNFGYKWDWTHNFPLKGEMSYRWATWPLVVSFNI